jgi:secretion/DNA translocation related CpaE-like protein
VSRPLICTADADVLDDLLRLAAAAGVEAEVAPDPTAARRSWSTAPAVLIGSDVADRFASAVLPRRKHVVLVGNDLDDAGVWRVGVSIGADHVVFLPDAETWLVDLLADTADGADEELGALVAVVGGRGGAGATTLATGLAFTAMRRGIRTMLVDADPFGGGIDLMLHGEDAAGLRWPDLSSSRGRVSADALSAALPRIDDLTVLSWGRADEPVIPPEAMSSMLAAGRRMSRLVVVDLPRSFDDAARVVAAECTLCLVVVPAEVRACVAAARIIAATAPLARQVQLVVRGPAPSGLRPHYIADLLGVPLAGYLRPEKRVAESAESGAPPGAGRGPLAALCRRVLDTQLGLGREAA